MSDTGHLKCPRCGKELTISAPEGLCPGCLAALNFATETNFSEVEGTEALPPLTPAELAPHFSQLEILECLGRGGMGVVYKARQKSLNRMVALKLLAPERVQDVKFAERFAREAQALALLNHPNIVTVHDFGQAGGFYFLLMEYVDGLNLRQLLRSRKLQPSEALAIVPPVCEALQYAHEHGIVHRDIKPENLLLAKDGRVKIADFGIAKILGEALSMPPTLDGQGERDAGKPGAATQQTTMGTPQYMAPEQREQPQAADHRADIYSLGVVLYELLTGELPDGKLQPPSRKVQIDVRLDDIVLRALEKIPERRYQTAGEFKTQVETIAGQEQDPKQRPGRRAPLLKAGQAYLTTREKLSTAGGQLFLYQDKCNLVLDERQIAFVEAKQARIVPLASIRDLSLGRFPLSVNPAELNFISLMYEEAGKREELIFAPSEGLFGAPSAFNDFVNQWYEAVRAAVVDATGKAPAATPSENLKVSSSSSGLAVRLGMMLIPVFVGIALFALWAESSRTSINRLAIVLPLVAVVLGLLVPLIRREGGGDRKSGGLGISWHIGVVVFYAGIILGILLIGFISLRFNRDSAYLFVVGLMAVLSPVVGSLAGNGIGRALSSPDRSPQAQSWLKAFSFVAWILALPVVGFGVFFFIAMLSDRGGWNPATSEAVIVPLTWVGSILLPFAGIRLKRAASGRQNEDSLRALQGGAAGPAVVAVAFAAACLSGILPIIFHWFATALVPSVTLEGRERMLWAALVAAILAVALGFLSRRSKFGMAALTVGLINLFIWVSLYAAGHYQTTLYGRPEPRETPYVSSHGHRPVQEPSADRSTVRLPDSLGESRVDDGRPAVTASKLLIIATVVALFTLAIVIVVWMTHKYGLKGFLLTAVIGSSLILVLAGTVFILFRARPVQPLATVEQAKAMEMQALELAGAGQTGPRLVATATLVPEFEREFRWRWRVNKSQPARLLFSLLDTDATGTYTNVLVHSLNESLPSSGNWGISKDVVITLFKEGDQSRIVLEDQFIAPVEPRPNMFSSIVRMEAWQSIRAQTMPVILSNGHYETLWEAQIVRHSADGKVKSPRRLRLVVRLIDPNQEEHFQALSEEDPVRLIRDLDLSGAARSGADSAKRSSNQAVGPLISEQILQEAREQDRRMKAMVSSGRASGYEAIDSETHLKWTEAMYKGEIRAALVARRDGAAGKLEIADKMVAAGRLSYAERNKLTRELAEAEAALKQHDAGNAR